LRLFVEEERWWEALLRGNDRTKPGVEGGERGRIKAEAHTQLAGLDCLATLGLPAMTRSTLVTAKYHMRTSVVTGLCGTSCFRDSTEMVPEGKVVTWHLLVIPS
jgi:hypothetical protein